MNDLFVHDRPEIEEIYPDMFVLVNFTDTEQLLKEVKAITNQSPLRQMMTPNGYQTNVALTNCGNYGWVSDIHGYRYSPHDPETGEPWLPIPETFLRLAVTAAEKAGYVNFLPDACLINRYTIGTRLGSHQDKDEKDFSWPIVSVSIGLPAIFQVFGDKRNGKPLNYKLYNGDVMVWGGRSRFVYHGVKPLALDKQCPNKQERINLTFRKAF